MAAITGVALMMIMTFAITGCSSTMTASSDNWDMDGDKILTANEFNTEYSKGNRTCTFIQQLEFNIWNANR